jgi:hypothetical protein
MESSTYGNAVILSDKGGLLETSKHYIKLEKLDANNLYKKINDLIQDVKKLKTIQKKAFYNSEIYIEKSAKIFDKIKLKNIKD